MDIFSEHKRSQIMSRIRGKDTGCEIELRKFIFSKGYRYRIHYKKLPGRPDIVFPGKKKVIFIHGCFWHQHEDCNRGKPPNSNLEYWLPKLKKNKERDQENIRMLNEQGWKTLIVWACEFRSADKWSYLQNKVMNFLES